MATKTSRKTHGAYLGLMRHAKRDAKSHARKIYQSKGIRSAVAYLRKQAKIAKRKHHKK